MIKTENKKQQHSTTPKFSINEQALRSHVRDPTCPFPPATKQRVLSWYAKKAKSTRLARRIMRDCSYVAHPSEILTQNPTIQSVSVPQQPLTRNIYHITSKNHSKHDNHSIHLHEVNEHFQRWFIGILSYILLNAYVDGDYGEVHHILNDGNYVGQFNPLVMMILKIMIYVKDSDSDDDKTMHFSDYRDTEQPFSLSLPPLNIEKYSSKNLSTKTVKLDYIVRIYFDPNSSAIEIVNGFLWRRNVLIHLTDMIQVHDKYIANWNHCYVREMAVAALCDPLLNITLTQHHRLDAYDVLSAELGSNYINVLNQMKMRVSVFDLRNEPLRGYILQLSNLKMECFTRQFSLSVNHLREHLRHDTIDQLAQYKHNVTALRQLNMI